MKIKKIHILKSLIIIELIIIIVGSFYIFDGKKKPSVLIVDIHGEIVGTTSPEAPNSDFWNRETNKVSAEEITKILKKYENDDNIKAFILDIDSNGGDIKSQSGLVQEIQQMKKPVVAVVRDQALSSGYYLAAGTNRIFANELSNIADIGVTQIIEYDQNGNGQYRKCYISSSEFKRMYYDDCPRFDKSKLYIEEKIRLINSTKLMAQEIATFRNLPEEHVLNLADGTIFTGIGALKLGLIDEIGGLHNAVDWLKEELGMDLEILYYREINY
ncbi:MAG: S49 family peptidase [Nanoarchaeota archaeon]|nr:S49 family peptidase [Nanoarchaeota archaeon]